jgi:DNA-damage-inducible protein D
MHDLQMELAADVIAKDGIRGEQRVIMKNKEIATNVRESVRKSGATMPENLPAEEPIKVVQKRLKKQGRLT